MHGRAATAAPAPDVSGALLYGASDWPVYTKPPLGGYTATLTCLMMHQTRAPPHSTREVTKMFGDIDKTPNQSKVY